MVCSVTNIDYRTLFFWRRLLRTVIVNSDRYVREYKVWSRIFFTSLENLKTLIWKTFDFNKMGPHIERNVLRTYDFHEKRYSVICVLTKFAIVWFCSVSLYKILALQIFSKDSGSFKGINTHRNSPYTSSNTC